MLASSKWMKVVLHYMDALAMASTLRQQHVLAKALLSRCEVLHCCWHWSWSMD
jgi:hypothetical protein